MLSNNKHCYLFFSTGLDAFSLDCNELQQQKPFFPLGDFNAGQQNKIRFCFQKYTVLKKAKCMPPIWFFIFYFYFKNMSSQKLGGGAPTWKSWTCTPHPAGFLCPHQRSPAPPDPWSPTSIPVVWLLPLWLTAGTMAIKKQNLAAGFAIQPVLPLC